MATQARVLPGAKVGGDSVETAEWVAVALVVLNVLYASVALGYSTF